MDKNIALVGQVVSQLAELGIIAIENPSTFRAYEGVWGSIANYKKVTLGGIRMLRYPDGSTTLGVFVSYEAHKESGEDLCDYNIKESRYVALDKLMSYLAERGIRRMSNGRVVRIRMRY